MNLVSVVRRLRPAFLSLAILGLAAGANAQSPIMQMRAPHQANRVPANPDLGPQTQLTGHLPNWVNSSSQIAEKAVDLSGSIHVSVVLQRDPSVQAAFEQFLQDQQTPGNMLYHQWLTPEQVGTLFGPTQSDVDAICAWLNSQGVTVISVAPSRAILEVSGTVSAIGNAFRTNFAYFSLGGSAQLSAVSEPFIPAAFSPVIKGIAGLTQVPLDPQNRRTGPQPGLMSTPSGPVAQPDYNSSSGTHYIVPADFNLIYDSASVVAGGNTGATIGANPQHIAIIGRSRVSTTSVSEFATNTGLSNSAFNVIVATTGTDPGPVCTQANYSTCPTAGDEGEATLDVERVLGTANGATVDLVISTTTAGTDGVYIASAYEVNTLKDPIMTISFGSCEVRNGSANTGVWDTLFSSAAAEGISVFVSSGDSGAAGCDGSFSNPPAIASQFANSPNVICVSQSATCVGGTEFNEGAGTFWSGTNATGTKESAISYIPEGGWNEPTTTGTTSGFQPASSGGGPSIYIAKPTWQTGVTIADNARDTPDISLSGAGHDPYYLCQDDALGPYITAGQIPANSSCATSGGGYFFGSYGTSAAAPGMAGLAALVNTKVGTAQGNFSKLLYKIYGTTPAAFHDVTVATSGVTTCTTATPSMCNNSIPGATSLTTGAQVGYSVLTGYDLVTGLGSLDAANFINAAAVAPISTTLAVTATTNPIIVGSSDTFTATLTRSSTTPGAATGTVQFYNGGVAFGSPVTISNNVATSASTTFSTVGTNSITAVYSGDTNYATSTAPALTLTVNAGPSFTVVPATTTYNLISGATTGNTDVVTLTSTNAFVGAVVVSCTVTNTSGTAAGTCASTTPVTLTSGGTGTSTLTITTTPGTSGVLSVVVKGTSGSTVVPSSAITVNLTASSYTMAATPGTITIAGNAVTGNTTTVTLTSVNGFAGLVTVGCSSSNTVVATCTGGTATLTSGGTATATVTALPVLHQSGSGITLTISGSGTTTGATIAATASTTATLNVTTVGSTTTVVSTPSTVVAGSPTVLKATVSGVSVNGTPTGTVTFSANGTAITGGTGTLSTTAGVTTATYTYTPTTPSATAVAITAVYGGDSGYAASTSAASNLTVSGATASAGTPSLTLTSGVTTGNTDVITFTSVSSFAGTITVACNIVVTSGSPAFPASCAPSPASITLAANGTATSTITITSTTAQGQHSGPQSAGLAGWGVRGGAVLAMLICLVPFRRRRFIRSLAAFVLLACGLVAISGCGGNAAAPVKKSSAGTYTVTTTGTSGTATASTTFTVTIN